MWYHISLTHIRNDSLFASLGMKFRTIHISRRLRYMCVFSDGWKVNINQEQWSLCLGTSLCAEHGGKATFFSQSPLKFCLFSLYLGDILLHIIFRGCFMCVSPYLNLQVTRALCSFPPPLQLLYQAVSKHRLMPTIYPSAIMHLPFNQHQILDSLALQGSELCFPLVLNILKSQHMWILSS